MKVVYRDADYVVVDKPSGLPTTAPGGGPSLVQAVGALDHEAPHLHPTSRLDAEVSGLVTFARTRRGNERLLRARREACYHRLYLAVVPCFEGSEEGCWQGAIARVPADPRKRRVHPSGKPSRTSYRVHARTNAEAALLALWPETGRTHQLRVHAAEAGIPFFGDVHYGGLRRVIREDGSVVTARRVMLHCGSLRFPSTTTNKPISVRAAPPADFTHAWVQLGGGSDAPESLLSGSPFPASQATDVSLG